MLMLTRHRQECLCYWKPSAKVGDFLIEMGQCGFQRLFVIGVSRSCQIVHDSGSRQSQLPDFLLAKLLLRSFWPTTGGWLLCILRFHLSFDVFAFPSSRHMQPV